LTSKYCVVNVQSVTNLAPPGSDNPHCGPPSPPGCEDPEFQRMGLAAKEAREHAMLIGGFLRKHGATHE
jgi:hypothetical protein